MPADDVGEALLREATALFARQGFDASSVQNVVDAAGVTKGAFYYYFESKTDLLFRIHERFISYAIEHAEDIVRRGLSPEETLRQLIVELVGGIENFQEGVVVFLREMRRLEPHHLDTMRSERDRYEAYFRHVLDAGKQTGAFRTDISTKLQSLGLLGMCNWAYIWYRPSGPLRPRQIAEAFADMLLAGLRPQPAPSRAAPKRAVPAP
jgi:AcrR family transcriptional regulator